MKNQDIRAALQEIRESATEWFEPTFDELAAYHEGRLSPDAEAALRERIVWSPTAIATLSALREPDGKDESPVSEIELAAVRRLVRRDRQPRWSWRFAASAAALLMVAIGTAGFGWHRVGKLEDRLEALRSPEPDVPIVELHRLLRSGDGQPQRPIEVATDRSTLFVVTIDPSDEYSSYRIELADSADVIVWRYDGLHRSAYGAFTFRLPAGAFAAGTYEVRLVGVSEDSSKVLQASFVRLGTLP